jgi:hypothetical protein
MEASMNYNPTARRVMIRTLQSRLAMSQDRMRRKIIDDNVSLISVPIDCIRMKARRHAVEGDDISWICEQADVISIVFPPLQDVPVRKIRKDKKTRLYQMKSLVSSFEDGEEAKFFTCISPQAHDVDVDDLLIRVMMDDDGDAPTVFLLQITELLGTFGGRMLIQQKFNATIPTVQIPQEVLETVVQMIERRRAIGW